MKPLVVAIGVGLIFAGLVLAVYGLVSSNNLVSQVGSYAYNPAFVYYAEWQDFQIAFYSGLVLGFIGVVLTVYGALSAKKIPPSSPPK